MEVTRESAFRAARRFTQTFGIALAMAFAPAIATGQYLDNRKISGDVGSGPPVANLWQLTPDGRYIVFAGKNGEAWNLYSRRSDGRGDVTLLAEAATYNWQITPDGRRVVYEIWEAASADEGYSIRQIYSRRLDGMGTSVRLNAELPVGGDVYTGWQLTDDGSQVVYMATQDTPAAVRLFRTRVDGSTTPTRITGPMHLNGDVESFILIPGGETAVFVADKDVFDQYEVYSTPLHGSDLPIKLSDPAVLGVNPWLFVTQDGARVLWAADPGDGDGDRIFSADPDVSGSGIQISGSTPLPIDLGTLRLSPDGRWAVYESGEYWYSANRLFRASVDTEGSQGPMAAFGGEWGRPTISPDSRYVTVASEDAVFIARLDEPQGMSMLFGPFTSGYSVGALQFTADGEHVIFLGTAVGDQATQLYRARLDDSSQWERLNDPVTAGGSVRSFELAGGDSDLVLYLADQDVVDSLELFAVPVAGGRVVKVNGPMVPGGSVDLRYEDAPRQSKGTTPSGRRVFYVANQERAQFLELFTTKLADRLDPPVSTRNGGASVPGGGVAPGP